MSNRLAVSGTWPGSLTISRGWARGIARPWNHSTGPGYLRLIRGGRDFVVDATAVVGEVSGGEVYSPALYRSASQVWKRAGYETWSSLLVLERVLAAPFAEPSRIVAATAEPDWDPLVEIDNAAFSGFWQSGRAGLEEAADATPDTMILTVEVEEGLAGYAIIGVNRSISFLQRLAVDPVHGGQGLGTDLVRAGLAWARSRGSTSMILNVREESVPARRLYDSEGFTDTGARLEVLRCQL